MWDIKSRRAFNAIAVVREQCQYLKCNFSFLFKSTLQIETVTSTNIFDQHLSINLNFFKIGLQKIFPNYTPHFIIYSSNFFLQFLETTVAPV